MVTFAFFVICLFQINKADPNSCRNFRRFNAMRCTVRHLPPTEKKKLKFEYFLGRKILLLFSANRLINRLKCVTFIVFYTHTYAVHTHTYQNYL